MVGEQPVGLRGVALVEQHAQRVLAAEHMRRARLGGQRLTGPRQLRFASATLAGEPVATTLALDALVAQLVEFGARRERGLLRLTQAARQTVALGGVARDLATDAFDLAAQPVEVGLGACGVARLGRPGFRGRA